MAEPETTEGKVDQIVFELGLQLLIEQGFAIWSEIDGERAIKITPAGFAHFRSLGEVTTQ